MIVNVISLVIQNIISKNQSLKGCPKKNLNEKSIEDWMLLGRFVPWQSMVNQDVNRLPFRGIFRDVTWILESHAFIIVFHEFLLSFLFIPFLRIWHSISRNQPTVCHSLRSPTLGSHVIVHVLGIPFLGFYSWDLTDRHKMNDSKNCPHNVESRNRQTFARKLFHFLFVLLVIILLTKNQLWD